MSKDDLNDSVSSHQIDDDEDYEILSYIDEDYYMAILAEKREQERVKK